MSLSSATVNVQNMILSPARLKFKTVDLGGTLGNITLAIETMKAPFKADQLGESELDYAVSGHKITLATEISEVALKDNWKAIFPHGNLVTSGGNKIIYFDSQIGRRDSGDAGALIVHPLSKPDGDLSSDINAFLAVAEAKSELVLSPNAQGKMKILFRFLPDFTTTPARWMIYGDPAIGLVAASFDAATYSGTGTGTMGSIAVHSGVTKSETITATALTATKFQVSGSLSGQLGVATTGVAFSSAVIDFTITVGGTAFIAGDQFQVVTHAANYV